MAVLETARLRLGELVPDDAPFILELLLSRGFRENIGDRGVRDLEGARGYIARARAGLDPTLVYEAISKGAAQSWQMDNRWATMVEGKFDFGFAVDWMRKDLGLVLDEARSNGAQLGLTALVDQFYAEVQAMGGRRWDTSSLVARLERE